jgi:hypothetical protein
MGEDGLGSRVQLVFPGRGGSWFFNGRRWSCGFLERQLASYEAIASLQQTIPFPTGHGRVLIEAAGPPGSLDISFCSYVLGNL